MNRRPPSILVLSAAVVALAPAAASAAGGGAVLLSGYAPSGASEEAVLGSQLPKAPNGSRPAATDLPLALPRGAVAASGGAIAIPAAPGPGKRSSANGTTAHAKGGGTSKPSLGTSQADLQTLPAADRAVVAAAQGSAGNALDTGDILIGALVLGAVFGLGALWRRQAT